MRLKRVDGAVDAGAVAAVLVRLPDSCAWLKSKSVTHRIGCAGSFTSVAEIIRMDVDRLFKGRCLRARG